MKKLISVPIPVFNAGKYLNQSINSILNQSYEHFEIIICDDGSNDNSLSIIKSFKDSRIKIFYNEVNTGVLKTRNKLFKYCKGDYIAFQDADDLSHPERFKVQLEAFMRDPDLMLCGTNFSYVNKKSMVFYQQDVTETDIEIKSKLLEKNMFQFPSLMINPKVLESIGGFREQFIQLGNISDDYDWILRISEKFKVGNVNYSETLYFYRSVPGSLTRSRFGASRLIGHQIAQYLAKQRAESGTDDIMLNRMNNLSCVKKSFLKPYIADPSLVFRELAASFMFNRLFLQAIVNSLLAIKKNPLAFVNYRTLQYCVRKSFILILFESTSSN
jgi:glycosyltransferase involved in cell wall biosynthesis|tara:strand:- start:163 stop:1149 length:987 start_codon:yes stop_codon:yes gene_type:complete